jgi:hypothetical protein
MALSVNLMYVWCCAVAYAIARARVTADYVKMPERIELCLLFGGKPFSQQSNAARLADVPNQFAPLAHGSNAARTVCPKTPKLERRGN